MNEAEGIYTYDPQFATVETVADAVELGATPIRDAAQTPTRTFEFSATPVVPVRPGEAVAGLDGTLARRWLHTEQVSTSGGGADESAAVDCSGAWSGNIRYDTTGAHVAFRDIADAFRYVADATAWTIPEPFSWPMVSCDVAEEAEEMEDGMAAAFEEVFT